MFDNIRATASYFLKSNAPAVISTVGIASAVAAVVLSGKASIKAYQIIDEEERERVDLGYDIPMTPRDKFDRTWRLYIPTGVALTISITSIVASTRVSNRRAAALATAYSISERAYEEYKEKVREKLGERKEQTYRDEIAQDRVNRDKYSDSKLIVNGEDKVIFYDAHSGRYFYSEMEILRRAENEINHRLIHNFYASLSDFYNMIGLPSTNYSDHVGWNSDNLMKLTFSTTLTDDDKPCIVFDFETMPITKYYKFR